MSDAMRRAALAERAARAGGVVARESFRGDLAVETKATKNDLVTATDRDAQRRVLATLRKSYPDDCYVCEETTDDDTLDRREGVPDTGHAWVVDPIDGTANFVRGIRFCATSVAAVSGGATVGVATYLPAEGDLYAAGPKSMTRNDEPMSVSDRSDPETFAVGLLGSWPLGASEAVAAAAGAVAERFGDVRRLGCKQGTLALVAAGGLDAAFAPHQPEPWDAVGGVHLIRRAGGTATGLDGERWHPEADGLVASNGRDHGTVLAAARQANRAERPEA
jgi:myo-inositol-1(or 4)-monophosphatase